MSDLFSKATVELLINGQQAQQTLSQLRQNALQLEAAIAKAAATGNKADLKRLRKELTDTKRQIREIESATQQVEQVLRNLDRATPRELNKTLQTLNHQLEYIERGSDAWNAHVEKIKRVKAEIHEVNAELRDCEGFWERFNRKMNDWQTTLMAGAAAITGLIMAGRSAVSAYAEMDQEMANVRKYTGMDEDQVKAMNEEFKKIDTRASREELNRLAQEAGRLGKSAQEDVLGFVRAANQINVALDELGDGATLTLSKLTNIFGDEKRLGTEQALLSVGSVINELSQNCTASAPYLANFAQRMAGVGAQAEMTIPQIMGLAAVLDSQGQKVEMSSTAVSKLIMDMFKQQDKIIHATGLNAKVFKETVTRDTNEGLLMLLEQLHSLGNIDVLAPVFKDMGENGSRAAQVIAALAGNIDMVKKQQEEAKRAFEEATSVTKEYDVQNNTVQAGLEKARKRVNEMAVELGEQLQPVMRHVISSTTLLLRFLSTTINFVVKYKEEIAAAAIALTAYAVAVNLATIKMKVATAAHAAWNVVVKASNVVMTIAQVLINGMKLAFEKYVLHAKSATTAQIAFNRSLVVLRNNALAAKAAIGVVALALAALAIALIQYVKRQSEEAKVMQVLNDIRKDAAKKMGEEKVKLDLLLQAAQNEKLSLDERQKAIKELNRIVPNYNAQLDATSGKYTANKKALDDYLKSMVKMYEIMGAKEKLQDLGSQKADLMIEKSRAEENVRDKERAVQVANSPVLNVQSNKLSTPGTQMLSRNINSSSNFAQSALSQAKSELDDINKKLDIIAEKERRITQVYGEDLQKSEVRETEVVENEEDTTTNTVTNTDTTSKAAEDKFKVEKEWKAREEALNRISYATGQENYEQYQKRILEIELEYQQKILEHSDLTEQERLEAQADYYETLKKMKEEESRTTVEKEKLLYDEQVAIQKQRFIDGEISTQVYQETLELLELQHLKRMTTIYQKGTAEQLSAQKAYQDRLIADQKRRQKEMEDAEKKHQDAMTKVKEKVFGDNPAERKAKYDADLALLTEVYNKELIAAGNNAKEKLRIEKAYQEARIALMEQYNIEGAELNKNFLQQWNDDMMSFLESDFGQAVSGTMDVLVSGMSSIFQQLTTIVQAELQIQTAQIEKKYDREISLAEGNNYKVKKLEKQKEKEIAKAKNEANKKMFAMQVIQAVAQTATNAINAYGSAAAIPLVGFIMAPIAAATAIAAGMLQVAAIKKQQQASEAQGYVSGGFTRSGRKDEVAGVVHAGEWVASQDLVKSPVARPIIEALDYAQRTNTVGSLNAEDVSRTITAPRVLADNSINNRNVPQQVIVQNDNSEQTSAALADYALTMRLLKDRLDEPFLTVNSVTGETGMKQAQEEYDKLIRNKTPKSRRS